MEPAVRRLSALFLAAMTLVATPAPEARAAAPESRFDAYLASVRKETLPNGLTLITRESPGSGVVAVNTWVKAGYFNEPDAVAGMAHLFEHMFFKGSTKFPGAQQIAQELSSVGGQTNAGTIYDSTNYYFVVPREGFRRAVEIQADAVMNPLFDPAELRKEAEVVIEESNRKLDSPAAVSLERMFATQFTEHRMRRWRIGSNEVLRNIRRDDLVRFFETLYRPENMILSIAGDVTHEEARALALETFGEMPRGTLDEHRGPAEPPQAEFRYGNSTADMAQGYSVLGWHTAGVGHADEIALDLLARVLGEGRSSRLFVNVVGPEGAATSSAAHYTFADVGVLFVQSTFDEARRAAVDRGVIGEVERMKAHGPTEYELRLAKNGMEAELAFALEDVLGQAQTLAGLQADYGLETLGDRLRALEALTTTDLVRVARKYLTLDNLTLYHYAPSGTVLPSREAALAAVREASAVAPEAPVRARIQPAPRPVRGAARLSGTKVVRLANGMTLLVKERPGAPVVSTSIYFPGGRVDENSRNAGITQLMVRSLQKGTRSRSGVETDREIAFLGTQLSVEVEADYFGIGIDVLARNQRAGVELLADLLLNPVFPAAGVAEERRLQLAAIRRAYDSSTQRPLELAFGALYRDHPYGLPANGYETSLGSLGAEAVRDWWRSRVVADGAVAIVVGDIDAEEARSVIEQAFPRLRHASAPRTAVAPPAPLQARLDVVEYRLRKQSALAYAFPAVPRSHEDWLRLRLLRHVTSGLAGTFFAELRGRRSLAYTVFAGDFPQVAAGSFVAYMATEAGKEAEAREGLLAELRRLPTDGFSEADVVRARKYYAGATRISLQTNDAQVRDLAVNWFAGLEPDGTWKNVDAAQAITTEDLRATARRYLGGDGFALAIVRGKDE
jgi:zinc protease